MAWPGGGEVAVVFSVAHIGYLYAADVAFMVAASLSFFVSEVKGVVLKGPAADLI